MSEPEKRAGRYFEAHETGRATALNGVPLAAFWQRLLGYFIDLLLAVII